MKKISKILKNHKKKSLFIIAIIALIIVFILTRSNTGVTSYVATKIRLTDIQNTVTGSGQILAQNQLDITSLVSGNINSINVRVGDKVKKGQIIATIDSKDAYKSLMSAKLAYEKITKPAKERDVSEAKNKVDKDYKDIAGTLNEVYSGITTVLNGMKSQFTDTNTYLSQNLSTSMSNTGSELRLSAHTSYDKARNSYEQAYSSYKQTNTSDPNALENAMNQSQEFLLQISSALQKANGAITFLHNSQPEYNSSNYSSAYTNINTWISTTNQYISSLSSLSNSLATDKNSLSDLIEGSDPLDIQSARLTVEAEQRNYADYFIRAPFDGIIARIPVNTYDRASSGTVIATIIGESKISNISLNEIDAQKVKTGQPVYITFDAIDGFIATGTVDIVDLVGTVSQGVVSYNVRIHIDSTDDRIRPGMSINIEIVTNEKKDVIAVPNTAIKSQGKIKYVEVVSAPQNNIGTSSRFQTITVTTVPKKVTVETGISNDQFTEITNGLSGQEFVVTKTITNSTATSQTPNILSSLGAQRPQGINTRTTTQNSRNTNTTTR